MIVGDKDQFAIEAEIEEAAGRWQLGRFRFWLCGEPVGNWEDTVDLRGCCGWLREFASTPRDRYEAVLENVSPERVFTLVYDPVMVVGAPEALMVNPYGRFHIQHLGMTAFDNFDLLLVKNLDGTERCLWRHADSAQAQECMFPPDHMESVAAAFCDAFEPLFSP